VNPRQYVLGLATILIVVAFVAILQNAIVKSSNIFVRLSETQVGEMDVVLTPDLASLQLSATSEFPPFWINESVVKEKITGSLTMVGSVPRWTLIATGVNPETQVNTSLVVLICDSIREQQIGVGRTWQRRPLVKHFCFLVSFFPISFF
jgi:hypothetical protein